MLNQAMVLKLLQLILLESMKRWWAYKIGLVLIVFEIAHSVYGD